MSATEALANAVKEWEAHAFDSDLEVDNSAEALVAMKLAIKAIKDAASLADLRLTEVMEAVFSGVTVLDDGTTVEVKKGRTGAKWDSDALIRDLVAWSRDEAFDRETGEFLKDPVEAAVDKLRKCSSIETPSHSWRTGALKEELPESRDVDEYRSGGGLKVSVIVTPAKEQDVAA